MKKLRFGIIGSGSMGSEHARLIAEADSREFCLTAVADIVPQRARRLGEAHGVEWFDDGVALMDSGLADAVLIATPHYYHPPLAIHAARRRLHVLTEKPMGVTVGPVRAMIAECRRRRVALGVMFQQRNRPEMRKMKRMLDAGAVGEVFRAQMLCSSWLRTQSYYDSGDWRGTWDGEGGGILINQAPHSLDLYQWVAGLPRRLLATVDTRHHRIEVENTANAILEYPRGKHGYIYATTAEAPGVEQLMVCGDRGTLVAEGGRLRFAKLKGSLKKHLLTARAWTRPECRWIDVPCPKVPGGHIAIVRAFVRHVLRGTPMHATGAEGVNELELSNAIYLSGFQGRPVELPVDAAEIDRLIGRLIRRKSTGRGGNARARAKRQLRKLLGRFPT